MAMVNQLGSAAQALVTAPTANRRRHVRYTCGGRAEVFLPHGGLLLRGRILDLSLSGCFIEAPALTLERGTHVEVFFVARQMQFRVSGHIAAVSRKGGAGVAFLNLSPRLARQVADPVHELKEISESKEITEPKELPA